TYPSLRAHLQALQIVQRDVWRPLAAAYQDKLEHPVVPHPFQIGDTVWVRRHQTKNLEPRWKGPYTVLLTTPTSPFSTTGGSTILISPSPGTGDRLFNLVAGAYLALNYSDPFRKIVRDNMAKLRERLAQRQKLFDSQQGWFEGWFNRSPWFGTHRCLCLCIL
uniref:Murine leukemia virus integrase C-terminal domain-containing protein n=1 Tax=Rattus norvegicus TaxID=10116 RepID=A0ABK0LXA2_RAT